MLEYSFVKEHFALLDGKLFKKLSTGVIRPINTVRAGRLVAVVSGKSYYGPELAWTLHYGSGPMFPVFCLDGDPLNLAQENVLPSRIRRLRFRFTENPSGFKHTLEKYYRFKSFVECKDDWLRHARKYYMADLANVLELQHLRDRQRTDLGYARPVVKRRAPPPPKPVAATKRPAYREGFRAYWHGGRWVEVPEACHVADDYRERCRRVLLGAVRFEFNHATQMVEGFDGEGVLVA